MKILDSQRFLIYLSVIVLICRTGVFSQSLTVREIMAEPSIAGMRVEGEKLSPDGSKVVFLWHHEGKMPRDLYMMSTGGGIPIRILGPSDLPPPSRPPEKENKLDYGLVLRDEFVKARESQLGNFEWSPDSKRLITSYGGDLYVITIPSVETGSIERWPALESAIQRRADLVPNLVAGVKISGLQEAELFGRIAEVRSRLLNQLVAPPAEQADARSTQQLDAILRDDALLASALGQLASLPLQYPQLSTNDTFKSLMTELQGTENRISVARNDFYDASSRKVRRLTRTQTPEGGARFLDNDRILYTQSGNVFIWDLSTSLITQISRESNPTAFVSVFNPTPNKPGTLVAYVVSDSSKQRALVVPNYLDEFAAAPTTRRGWTEQKVLVVPADGSRETPFEIKLPKPDGVSSIRRMVWAADNSSLIVDRIDMDTKRRQLYFVHNVGSKSEKIIPVTEEVDAKWQASLSSIFEPNPKDPSELFFGSERDGYNHLYVAKLETTPAVNPPSGGAQVANVPAGYTGKVEIRQHTSGSWQVEWARWLPDGNVLFLSTEKTYRERELYILDPRTGTRSEFEMYAPGMKTNVQLSESGEFPVAIFELSRWNMPGELKAVRVCRDCLSGGAVVNLGHTVPMEFTKVRWIEPKFIEIPSKDGKKIPAKIYLPPGFNPNPKQKTKYPMAIFVHGAGYLQNVINGWNNYYREFMFNHMLAQKGYVVLDIDYRGSAGYGRDWRTDVYDFLGGKDYDDHIDAIDHMVANYNVNQSKIGAYGGSYGGFMAGMLVMRAPERIAAAAALRPVFDWKNYYAANPGYTAQRLGFPDKNPEAYRRSSPISYADKLERPLLILHGMADDNVHVQDSVQLMEKLIRLGKTKHFEAMLYPSENHGFVRPESWADEYERILAFFEKHLK